MARPATSRVIGRVKRFDTYRGQRVTVVMGSHDGLQRVDGDEVTGVVLGIATRHQGNADWAGRQYDMVLRTEDGLHVFALSRIRSIRVIGGTR